MEKNPYLSVQCRLSTMQPAHAAWDAAPWLGRAKQRAQGEAIRARARRRCSHVVVGPRTSSFVNT